MAGSAKWISRFKSIVKTAIRRWTLSLIGLSVLLLTGFSAQAMDYVFSADPLVANLYPGCTGPDLANKYMCGELTLIKGDTIKITQPGTTIRFGSQVNLGVDTSINQGGQSADLTLDFGAIVFLGTGSSVTGNIKTSAAITLENGSKVDGIIEASSTLGIVVTKDGCVVTGAITATDGAISIGDHNTIKSTLLAMAGAVTIGNYSQIAGDITASAGAVTVGFNSVLHAGIFARSGEIVIKHDSVIEADINGGTGNITTYDNVMLGTALKPSHIYSLAGIVTVGANNVIGNISTEAGGVFVGKKTRVLSISTNAGNITIQDSAVIGPITSTVGIITLRNDVIVNGDIISQTGAVNVESFSRVCGKILVTGAGLVTVTSNVGIAGSITSDVGAITIGGNIGTLVPNTTVGGNVISNTGTISIILSIIGGNVDGAGTMTVRDSVVGGSVSTKSTKVNVLENQNISIPPPNCNYIPEIPIDSTATGLFDCLEVGRTTPALFTKLAGTEFTLDIVALNADKTVNSRYVPVGAPLKYTKVELFDDPDTNPVTPITPLSCASYQNRVDIKIVSFSGSSVGRTTLPIDPLSAPPKKPFNIPTVHQKLRCRVTECSEENCTVPPAVNVTPKQSCSSDQFSVRPVAVTLSSDANAPAPSVTAMPMVKAGANFNLSAVTASTDNYWGVLTLDTELTQDPLDTVKLTAQNTTQDTTKASGGVVGKLTPTLTANAIISTATYSEVGYLYLAAGAYRDDNFTSVDNTIDSTTGQRKGDCIVDSLSDIPSVVPDQTLGKYGCRIGNTALATLGRFTPDHFGVGGTEFITRSDLQTVESQSNPFTYMDEPMQLGLTVTAYNAGEGVTQNYQGVFAKLNTTNWNLTNWFCTNPAVSFPILVPLPVPDQCMGLSASDGSTSLTDRLVIDTLPTPQNTVWSKGSSNFTANIKLQRNVIPDGPYDDLKFGAKPQDLDGITLPPNLDGVTLPLNAVTDTAHCVNLNKATGGEASNCTFALADETVLRRLLFTTRVRFGRLSLANASGSELVDLSVPVEAQYWNGSSFAVNTFDNLTTLANTNIVLGNYQGLSAIATPSFRAADANGSCSGNLSSSTVLKQGKSCILFGKPSVSGSFDALVNLGSTGSPANCLGPPLTYGSSLSATLGYLSGKWCGGDGSPYDRDPTAHVTFGIYNTNGNSNGNSHLIYFREVY